MVGVESFFKETREHLCSKLREAHVDHEAFDQLIRRCELAICRATCCHDGVRLSEGDAMAIKSLVSQNEDVFREYGVELDDEKTKQAGEGGEGTHCPVCLKELDDAGACPVHGTEPFEPTSRG